MAKISELSNEQLLKNIEKYQKLLKGLHKERERRTNSDPSLKKTLFTREELAKEKSSASASTDATTEQEDSSTERFQINFEESEIEQIEEMAAKESKANKDEQDGPAMTQVLNLTSAQLKEFNKGNKGNKKSNETKKNSGGQK